MKKVMLGVILGLMMLATVFAVSVLASIIFDDHFDDPALPPGWTVSPGKGSYSLTDNPGYLRYIIDAWGWDGGAIPLQLIRPFSGDQWILRTAITYNMRPAEPTNNRNMHFLIRTPGEGTIALILRSVGVNDGNPDSNVMRLYAGDNGPPIYFPNSPNPLPLERWYFEIERNGDYIAVRASNDGDDSTFEYTVEDTVPPGTYGNDQEVVIQATGWYGSNDPPGYADFDFITVVQAPPSVSSVNPSQGTQGESLSVATTGTYFTGATTVSFGSGITVNSFTVDNATQITASITIGGAATPGPRDVSVTTPGGTATLTGGFTVLQAPPLPPVGGTIIPTDKAGLVMPWIAAGALILVAAVSLAVWNRKRGADRTSVL